MFRQMSGRDTRLNGIAITLTVSAVLFCCAGANREEEGGASQGQETPLRQLAADRGIMIGAAVGARMLRTDSVYCEVLQREFDMVATENAMKFAPIHPARDRYAFDRADTVVQFAQKHNMKIRGHTLVWHKQLPRWLTQREWSRQELVECLHEHIATVVGRYRGQVEYWDVVNEAVFKDGSLRTNIWHEIIGPSYIELAFRWAHEVDPSAKLFYNDFEAEGLGTKSDGVYDLLVDLLARDVPIHGVGLQMHVDLAGAPDPDALRTNIERLAELGLEVHSTEMDVRLPQPPNDEHFQAQAEIYRSILVTALRSQGFKAFVTWGFTDRYSWIPRFFPGTGSALILDVDYQPKPAYDGLREALKM